MTSPALLIQERICSPLEAALNRLENLLANKPTEDAAWLELSSARDAVKSLAASLMPAHEILTDFLSAYGPLEALISRAEDIAYRTKGVDEVLVKTMTQEGLDLVVKLFTALAPTAEVAATGIAYVTAQTSLLEQALTEAQRDGCERGGYASTVRDDMAMYFANAIATAAREFVVYPDGNPPLAY